MKTEVVPTFISINLFSYSDIPTSPQSLTLSVSPAVLNLKLLPLQKGNKKPTANTKFASNRYTGLDFFWALLPPFRWLETT